MRESTIRLAARLTDDTISSLSRLASLVERQRCPADADVRPEPHHELITISIETLLILEFIDLTENEGTMATRLAHAEALLDRIISEEKIRLQSNEFKLKKMLATGDFQRISAAHPLVQELLRSIRRICALAKIHIYIRYDTLRLFLRKAGDCESFIKSVPLAAPDLFSQMVCAIRSGMPSEEGISKFLNEARRALEAIKEEVQRG